MRDLVAPHAPPFCPNPACPHHLRPAGWRFKRDGFHHRRCPPRRIQRYRCGRCHRSFSTQSFACSYWLRRPDLLPVVFWRLLGCSAYRQIARELGVAPSTIAALAERLGRHALLLHERLRPKHPIAEPLVADGFESFEFSQYFPLHLHLAVGAHSQLVYGFTDSELRRKGRMTAAQRRRRHQLELRLGRPDPRSVELEFAQLLRLVAPMPQRLTLRTDDHPAYRRALRRLPHLAIEHQVTSSRARRTTSNPLFPVNLLDLLIRHCGANHKRETIAFSKRRQSVIARFAVLLVWRNYLKPCSERRGGPTPAMRLGLLERPLAVAELLGRRLFPSRVPLPQRWRPYYWGRVRTRALAHQRHHHRRYAA